MVYAPCSIPWYLKWLGRHYPELTPADQPLLLSLFPPDLSQAPVPAACADRLPPHVRQIGRPQ